MHDPGRPPGDLRHRPSPPPTGDPRERRPTAITNARARTAERRVTGPRLGANPHTPAWQPRRATRIPRPIVSGRGSQPDGSLVAALLTEQKSADHRGAPLRFVPGTSLARTHSSGCQFRFATSGGLRRRDGSPIRCESHASRDVIGPAAPWKRTRGPDRDYCTREARGPMLTGS
jgi:hypothetical protein